MELDAVPPVDTDVAVVVLPTDSKADDPIRLGHPFEDAGFSVLRVLVDERDDLFSDFAHGLVKLLFVRITTDEASHESVEVHGPCDDQFHNVFEVDEKARIEQTAVSQSARTGAWLQAIASATLPLGKDRAWKRFRFGATLRCFFLIVKPGMQLCSSRVLKNRC